jgi:hypothetical protein
MSHGPQRENGECEWGQKPGSRGAEEEEGDPGIDQWLREVLDLSGGEDIVALLSLLLHLFLRGDALAVAAYILGSGDRDRDGAPVDAIDVGGEAHVEQHNDVLGEEVVLHSPLAGERRIVGEIIYDGDAAMRGGHVGSDK